MLTPALRHEVQDHSIQSGLHDRFSRAEKNVGWWIMQARNVPLF